MQKYVLRLLTALCASFFFLACGSDSTLTTPVATLAAPTQRVVPSAYPPPVTGNAYPGPPVINVFQTPEAPTDIPAPESGKASVAGVLYSYTAKMVLPGTLFYLTLAVGSEKQDVPGILSGPEDDAGDIRSQANDKGQFVLTDVPPGNYYLVVSAPLSWTLGQDSPEASTPWLIELAPDQRVSLSIVYLSWP